MEVRTMVSMKCQDMTSVTGSNLAYIRSETGKDPWTYSSKEVKAAMSEHLLAVPAQDSWRLPFLAKLLAMRGEHYYKCMDITWLTEQIDTICVN